MLIAITTYDTPENNRSNSTLKCLQALREKTNFITSHHRIIISDNGSTATDTINELRLLERTRMATVLWNGKNIGTAYAINRAWKLRQPNEICCKMDNDIIHKTDGWCDQMEDTLLRDSHIGFLGLKRHNGRQYPTNNPNHLDPVYKSTLHLLPQQDGNEWRCIEQVRYVIGSCVACRPDFLTSFGYYEKVMSAYGFEDLLASVRCWVLGYCNAYLHGPIIYHHEEESADHTADKELVAKMNFPVFCRLQNEYIQHIRPPYVPYNGGES